MSSNEPPLGEELKEVDQAALSDGEPALPFPIVGVGASAGGLAALTKFLSNIPIDSGIAFVLVPHLDPTHESLMVELLSRETALPVSEAQDGEFIQPNHVYLIPPNKYLALRKGQLTLAARPNRHGSPTAIDYFFDSLAREQRSHAIGIILSGTSSHGTIGLKEIKLRGGMVIVQQPETAEFNQMPANAIATGLVDFVLPPERMAEAILKYAQQPYVKGASPPTIRAAHEELDRVLTIIRSKTKYDFRSYRKNMLMRRVLRRMGLRQIEQLQDYVTHLHNDPDEITALYKDLLIGVTDFFRDPQAFDVLRQRVIPELVEHRLSKTPASSVDAQQPTPQIRVWVPACTTGEEAYSIAMLLIEYCTDQRLSVEIQVFATDIDEQSLETARQGVYPESSIVGIAPERLQRFFTKLDQRKWKVNKQLRDVVTVAPQNLISDAPFSKLDLISCRNLLIYLEPSVQAKVIRLFHFALSEGGHLMLGPSETIGREEELFTPVSKKWRLFRRIDSARRNSLEIPIVMTENRRRRLTVPSPELVASPLTGHRELMQRVILDEFVPASALINRNHQILCVMGPLVDYLEFPAGEMTTDLVAMARPGLRAKVRSSIYKAIHAADTVVDREARVKRDGVYVGCTVTVKPVSSAAGIDSLLLVTFQDNPAEIDSPAEKSDGPPLEDDSHVLQHLEHELKSTREDLQSTIEEYESSTEELKASNEEVMSMNEELQSSNEELESSKEELQSLNEELHTVNIQMQEKVEELDRSNSDLLNLMASSDVATLFLDTELRIKRFTPPVVKLLNLRPTDIDRAITDFALRFDDDTLLAECRAVLQTAVPVEREIWSRGNEPTLKDQRPDDQCYLRRVLPYHGNNKRIEGVVVTLVDITARMMAEAQSRRLALALRDSSDAITLQDFDGQIIAWNRGAASIYGFEEAEALKMNIRVTVPEHRQSERQMYIERVRRGDSVPPFDTQRLNKAGEMLDIQQTVAVYRDERGRPVGIATTERDISERKRLQKQVLEIATEEQRRIGQELHDGTGQELTGLSLFAGTLVDLLGQMPQRKDEGHWIVDDEELRRLKQTATRLADGLSDSQRHIQQLSHGILPVLVEGQGLRAALQELVDTMNTQQKVACSLECPDPIEIANNSTATHLYRIAQEAVNNAMRHGDADQIMISLIERNDEVILEICDNGVGIDANISDQRSGFGLGIMNYRADLIGGTLHVGPRDGGGTVVRSCFFRELLK